MSSRGRRGIAAGWGAVALAMVVVCPTSSHAQDHLPAAPSVEDARNRTVPEGRAVCVLPSPQSEPGSALVGGASRTPSACETGVPVTSIKQLLLLDDSQLDFVYQSARATTIPSGKIRGRVILFPGSRINRPASSVSRLIWQGKVFNEDGTGAVNRFFGLRMIKARVYQGRSWIDGGPSLILDYQKTSWVYAKYRDEIREVAPGIYLGLMYARTQPEPTFKMYFALDASR